MLKALFLKSAATPLVLNYVHIDEAGDIPYLEIVEEVILPISASSQPSKVLFDSIDQLLKKHNVAYSDLDRIYVASGPGSYTGARLLVTIVKTIHFLHPDILIYDASILDVLLAMSGEVTPNQEVPQYAVAYARKNKYYFAGIVASSRVNDTLVSTQELLDMCKTPCIINGTLFKDGLVGVEQLPDNLAVLAWKSVSHKLSHDDLMIYEPYYLESVNIG